MSDPLISLLAVALILALAALAWMFRHNNRLHRQAIGAEERLAAKAGETLSLQEQLQGLRTETSGLQAELAARREELATLRTSLEHERNQFEEKLSLLNDSRDQLTVAFKNIANEIFEDKTKKFTANSRESLATVLNPLSEKIAQFEKRVEETYDKEAKERFSLAKEIKNLQELNSRISEEAVNLTNALKGDNKAQGSWGEFVLESILEKSGLVKGREYEVQVNLKAEDGSKYQPDVVVHLPEARDIVIDSKVSLKAWDDYASSDEPARREELLKQHVQSVRLHVRNLAAKDYQNLPGLNTLDYIFLFMPIEAAYSEASRADSELLQYAYDRNIIFVGPTTLLTAMKMVQNLWRLAQQSQNANEIAEKAGALYDKFVNFVDDLDEVGVRIDASRKSFDKAHNKLKSGRGNLIRRVELLKELGAKTSKKHKRERLATAVDESDALVAPVKSEAGDGADEEAGD